MIGSGTMFEYDEKRFFVEKSRYEQVARTPMIRDTLNTREIKLYLHGNSFPVTLQTLNIPPNMNEIHIVLNQPKYRTIYNKEPITLIKRKGKLIKRKGELIKRRGKLKNKKRDVFFLSEDSRTYWVNYLHLFW